MVILLLACVQLSCSRQEFKRILGHAPGVIYGTAWKKNRTKELVLSAVRAGYRAFDTAAHPRHYNESLMGDALREIISGKDKSTPAPIRREDLWIQTKFTPDACVDMPIETHPYNGTWSFILSIINWTFNDLFFFQKNLLSTSRSSSRSNPLEKD
jgi:hypothetical protein